jgi:hypothetical protein
VAESEFFPYSKAFRRALKSSPFPSQWPSGNFFPGGWRGRFLTLTANFHLVSLLGINGAQLYLRSFCELWCSQGLYVYYMHTYICIYVYVYSSFCGATTQIGPRPPVFKPTGPSCLRSHGQRDQHVYVCICIYTHTHIYIYIRCV